MTSERDYREKRTITSKKLIYLTFFGVVLGLNTRGWSKVSNPSPEDGAIFESTWASLSWQSGDHAVSYDIYFGVNFDDVKNGTGNTFHGNQVSNMFIVGFPGFPIPEGLVPGTTYYWRIDEVNDLNPDSPWEGDVWSFKVPSQIAYNPDPPNGAQIITTNITLSWEPGFRAKLHVVYLGDDFDEVNASSVGSTVAIATYTPGPLELGKTYYWRVDEFDAVTTHKGDVWSFTVGAEAPGGVTARTIYVDDDATGVNDGSGWADAYCCLQDALADAQSGDEIHVAQGTYRPDRQVEMGRSAQIIASGDRAATFQLISGVTIKGGYAGSGRPDPDARDIKLYETILSGDLNDDDGPDFRNNSENSYHIITGSGTDPTTVLEGFFIINGNADSLKPHHAGGGIYNQNGSPTLINCTFETNWGEVGGAMANDSQSNPIVTNCTFRSNSAVNFGGGIYNLVSSPILTDCVFIYNSAIDGGGILNWKDCSPKIGNCTFYENSASGDGGAIYCHNSSPNIENCTLTGNSTGHYGGGIYCDASLQINNNLFADNSAQYGGGIYCGISSSSITNCTIVANVATGYGGGGIYCGNASPVVVNTILWDNSPDQIYLKESTITVAHSDVQSRTSQPWPGEGNIKSDPMFVNSVEADYRILPSSPCIDAGDNSAIPDSILTDLDGNPRIENHIVDMGAYENDAPPMPNIYYVDAINGDDNNNGLTIDTAFVTIQKGIATAIDGETVLVYPGIYQEEVDLLGKAITVQGVVAGRTGAPVIQNPGDFAVSFYSGEGPDTILKNFIVRGSFMGVFIAGSSPTISNLTITGNKYGIEAYVGSEPDISNVILWDNTNGNLFGCEVRYSCIQRGGEGDIVADPLFVDPASGDYRLRSERGRYWSEHDIWVLDTATSPCIDAGDPAADVSDEPMPNGGRINIGAYGGTPQASLSLQQLPCLPCQASNPSPTQWADDVATDVVLSWTAGANAVSHDIYFGINESLTFVGNQTATHFDPGVLNAGTTYVWRIDEINSAGKTTGQVWTFATHSDSQPPPPPKGRACFLADTPVWVDGVLRRISNIAAGQLTGDPHCVLATEYLERIETIEEHEGSFQYRDITLESGNCISVVDAHCFMLESGRWIAAQDLRSGQKLRTLRGTVSIKNVATRAVPFVGKVYNLKIENSDKYFVGKDAIVVRDY